MSSKYSSDGLGDYKPASRLVSSGLNTGILILES